MIESLLDTLGQTALALRIAEDPVLFPWLEVAHVFAITTVFGSVLLVDLRLMGLAARDYPVKALSRAIIPVTWVAFVIAVITGSLLFISNPLNYFDNFYFRVKMLLILAAGLNMALFHLWTMRGAGDWDRASALPMAARGAGLISIVLWVSVVACGRWIGFTMAPF